MKPPQLQAVLDRLKGVRQKGDDKYEARCPAHDDNTPSLSIGVGKDQCVIVHCHAGCTTAAVLAKAGLTFADLSAPGTNGNGKAGLTLAELAADKGLPVEFLSGSDVGLTQERDHWGRPYVAIPYLDSEGKLIATKQRTARAASKGSYWQRGKKAAAYGAHKLSEAKAAGYLIIEEGESDWWTLRYHGFPALGLPGADMAGKLKAEHVEGIAKLFVMHEPDEGGDKFVVAVPNRLMEIGYQGDVFELRLDGAKDPNELHKRDPAGFKAAFQAALDGAQPITGRMPDNPRFDEAGEDEAEADAEQGISNARWRNKRPEPIPMTEILATITKATSDALKRVGGALFVHEPPDRISWLTNTPAVFGWLKSEVERVRFYRGAGLATKEETYHELRRTASEFLAVERVPHEPPITQHYYACATPEPGDGVHLKELVDRFRPASDLDKQLIYAMFTTTVWGGAGGTRPAFVITTDDGPGAGKSTLAALVAYVVGGAVEISPTEDISTVKGRLLSEGALTTRIAVIDNVKTTKFSWADLEALVTAPVISGKRMYVGEATRPNTLTWIVTLNGVSLGTDMAQRAVVIKLQMPAYTETFLEDAYAFIDKHRAEIVGDIVGVLREPPNALPGHSRWSSWERDVLARMPAAKELQALIRERQAEADAEGEEGEIIEDFFAEQLKKFGYGVESERVRITTATAARWLGWATNERNMSVPAAGRKLMDLIRRGQLKRLARETGRSFGRCFVWCPPEARIEWAIRDDLQDKIAEVMRARAEAKATTEVPF